MRKYGKNFLLVCLSFFFTLLIVFLIDRLLPSIPVSLLSIKSLFLIFPPNSEEEFMSSEFHYKVKINTIGIREREINIPKGKDIFRILVFGDSYTYGWGVDAEETWIRYVENKLQIKGRKVETVNLGKPGAEPFFYLELARKAIPLLQPDLVIVSMLQGDDLYCLGEVKKEKSLLSSVLSKIYPNIYKLIQQRKVLSLLQKTSANIPPMINSAQKNQLSAQQSAKEIMKQFTPEEEIRFNQIDHEIQQLFLDGLLNPFLIAVSMKNPDLLIKSANVFNTFPPEGLKTLSEIFIEFKKLTEKQGSLLLIFNVPQSFFVNKHALAGIQKVGFQINPEMLTSTQMDQFVEKACNMANVPFIEITSEIRQYQDDPDLFFSLDSHPTPKGHKLIGELFFPKLQKFLDKHIHAD